MLSTYTYPRYSSPRAAELDHPEKPHRRPVVVVGAGPVGLAAAIDLAQHGQPVLLLDHTPLRGRRTLDLSFPALGPVLAAVFELGGQIVAVGRSENPREPEVAHGGDLPWEDGRLVGGATTSAEALALGANVDAHPPPRLVTVGMSDGANEVFFTIQRSEGLWLTINSLTPPAAAQWINFADYAAQQGADAARARFGSRLKVTP